jgi:hypothetical protein
VSVENDVSGTWVDDGGIGGGVETVVGMGLGEMERSTGGDADGC